MRMAVAAAAETLVAAAALLKEQEAEAAELEEVRRLEAERGELVACIAEMRRKMEGLQQLLGVEGDTRDVIRDMITAVRDQQREAAALKQLQLEMRRQILKDSENMIRLLTGASVIELELEMQQRRLLSSGKRGDPSASIQRMIGDIRSFDVTKRMIGDIKAQELLLGIIDQFRTNVGDRQERAKMLLALQTKAKELRAKEGFWGALSPPSVSSEMAEDMWKRSATDYFKTPAPFRANALPSVSRDLPRPLAGSPAAASPATAFRDRLGSEGSTGALDEFFRPTASLPDAPATPSSARSGVSSRGVGL